VGAGIAFAAGTAHRAPEWMQRSGLEWLHRLIHEPRRLFRRYVVHGLPFAAQLAVRAIRDRRTGGTAGLGVHPTMPPPGEVDVSAARSAPLCKRW